MAKCSLHPGRESVANTFGQNYCKICQDGIDDAVSHVDRHVQPKDCFVWYKSNDNWEPIIGTGCAHWVSHQLGIHTGTGGEKCLAGFTYRVRPVVLSRMPVPAIADVKVNDIWASPTLD